MDGKNKRINIIFSVVIGIIVIAIIGLTISAVIKKDDNITSTETPSPTESGSDEFDANSISVREDPVIMTVNMSPVKFSEFNYFYYIAASEVLNNLEYPDNAGSEQKTEIIKNALNNGIEGREFDEIVFEKAKNYAVKYLLYRKDYISLGYGINESYKLYLESNYLRAGGMEELGEINNNLLYEYGVVRNEYIDILVYNDLIDSYKSYLKEHAEYTQEELKKLYDEKTDVFNFKGIRVIILGKEDEELAETLKAQIDSGYDMESLVKEYSLSSSKDSNKGLFEGNDDSFDEMTSQWLKTAKLNDSAVIKRENDIYVVKYENDGSFEYRKKNVSDYKAVYDYDSSLDKKINDGEIDVIMYDEVVSKLKRPEFLAQYD